MSALVDVDLVLCMVTLPPLPIFPNNYMLDSSTTHKKETMWVENTASTSESRNHHFSIHVRYHPSTGDAEWHLTYNREKKQRQTHTLFLTSK